MIDRPGVENRFGCPEDVFHLEQFAIAQHDGERVEAHVGAQDVETVISRILGDPPVVDLEVLVVGGLEVTPIGAVADERLVAAAQALAQAWPRWPSVSPPRPSKYNVVVSMNTTESSLNKSRRRANSSSSIRSLTQRGASVRAA